ncbi:MAG: CsgG/HfaB family protein [Methylococcales bacterium]
MNIKHQTGLIIVLLLSGGVCWGKLPERPTIESYVTTDKPLNVSSSDSLGRIELANGDVQLLVLNTRNVYKGLFEMPVARGDVIKTSANSRCRVVTATGDVIHLGPDTLLGLNEKNGVSMLHLWQGQLMVYGMPMLQGREQSLKIHTPEGRVELKTGKINLKVGVEGVKLSVYEHTAKWIDNQGKQKKLARGQIIQVTGESRQVGLLPGGAEVSDGLLVSPESSIVRDGIKAFREKDFKKAETLFSQTQSAYPYNPAAAYHLGVMKLEQNDLKNAIRQWQRYVKIEPESERAKEVKRNLTLLVSQNLKEEAKRILANEAQISDATPTPNSIAVHPLLNKGQEKYRYVGKGLTALVISDLAKIPNLKVLERQKIQKLLDEIKLSRSGLSDKEVALRSGRLLRAEKLILGDYKIGKKKGLK